MPDTRRTACPAISKYHRRNPIREFDEKQTLYSLVFSINKSNLELNSSSYLGGKTTFSELLRTTDALASALHTFGVKSSEHVGACLMTVPEVSPTLLAVSKLGAVSCWLDGSLKAADLLKYINRLELRILIIHELILPELLPVLDKTGLEKVIVVETDPRLGLPAVPGWKEIPGFCSFADAVESAPETELAAAKYEENKTTVIVQSSGSTGMPKLIEHTDYNFNAGVKRMAYGDIPLYLGRRALVCAPPWVIYGLLNSMYSGLVLGNETVYTSVPHEEQIVENLGQFDYIYGVPVYIRYLYNVMCALKETDAAAFKQMRNTVSKIDFIISGGDKLTEDEVLNWQQMFDVPVLNGYGNNEVCGAAAFCPVYANRPGSIGVPLFGNRMKTFDPETGEMLEEGAEGDIGIASGSLFKGYLGNEEEAKKLLISCDGELWVRTGDLGYIDKDGFVFIHGRSRRLIIDKLGYKISPDHSESIIQSCVGISECAVVGAKRAEHDMVPVAYIEPNGSLGEEQVIELAKAACAAELKDYEIPQKYICIEKMPHKVNGGKLDFLKLEEMAAELEWN